MCRSEELLIGLEGVPSLNSGIRSTPKPMWRRYPTESCCGSCRIKLLHVFVIARFEPAMLITDLHASLVGEVDHRALLMSFHFAYVSLFYDSGPEAEALLFLCQVVRLKTRLPVLAVKNGRGARHKHGLVDANISSTALVRSFRPLCCCVHC